MSSDTAKVEVEQAPAQEPSHELEDSQLEEVAGGAQEMTIEGRHAEEGGR